MSTEVATLNNQIAALTADMDNVMEAMSFNLGNSTITEFDLTRITVPTGGGLQWIVPTLDGEKAEATLTGVIVFTRDVKNYWAKPLGEETRQPPDCWSIDGLYGFGDPGGDCLKCPLNVYGSSPKGAGKACNDGKQIFMLRGSGLLPEMVSIPATSLHAAKSYLLKLIGQGYPFYRVVTAITLERATNTQGVKYAQARFSFVRTLPPEQAEVALQFHRMVEKILSSRPTPLIGDIEADGAVPREA